MVFISIHNWEQIERKDADDMPTMFESAEDNTPSPTPNSKKRFSKSSLTNRQILETSTVAIILVMKNVSVRANWQMRRGINYRENIFLW